MIIRSITYGVDAQNVEFSNLNGNVKRFFKLANSKFQDNSIELRTQRIGLSPFNVNDKNDHENVLSTVASISKICKENDIRWFVVPFNLIKNNLALTNETALDVLKNNDNTFVNFKATEEKSIGTREIESAAILVKEVSMLSPTGFDNFRFGVSFNTKPNGAFFPFMHHKGEDGFSVALELIKPIVEIVKSSENTDLMLLRDEIIASLVNSLSNVNDVCVNLERETGVIYNGIDASLAPHPENKESSVPYLMKILGLPRFGQVGTAFLASYLTDIIKSIIKESGVKATGFNGVMYSILEDHGFTDISKDLNSLPVSQLLSVSAICGCGVDMLPVPGDITTAELKAIMLDVSAKATWLDKPLGARILPIPNKTFGDITEFEHDFFVNTRIQNSTFTDNFDLKLGKESLFTYSRDNECDFL